jgi:hypothetical protein
MMSPHRALVADIAGDKQTLAHALVSIMDTGGGLLVTGFSSVLNPTVYIKEFMLMVSSIMFVTVVVSVALAGPADVRATKALAKAQTEIVQIRDAGNTTHPSKQDHFFVKYIPDTLAEIKHLPKAAWPVVIGYLFWNITSSTFGSFWVAFAAETVLGGEAGGADICADLPSGCTPGQVLYNAGVVDANRAALIGSCLALAVACLLPMLVSPRFKLGIRPVFVVTTSFTVTSVVAASLYKSLTITSGSALYVLWRGIAGGAAGVLPFAVVGEVVGRECPEKLGLFLGTLNIFNVCGQVIANMLTTFTSSSDWGYGKPIFIGGLLGTCMPLCGLLISSSVGVGGAELRVEAGDLSVNANGCNSEPLLVGGINSTGTRTSSSSIRGDACDFADLALRTNTAVVGAHITRETSESVSAAMITAPILARQADTGAGSFFFLQHRYRYDTGAGTSGGRKGETAAPMRPLTM